MSPEEMACYVALVEAADNLEKTKKWNQDHSLGYAFAAGWHAAFEYAAKTPCLVGIVPHHWAEREDGTGYCDLCETPLYAVRAEA